MGDKSGIEWTDATWNPVTGCSKVSPGCANCYAETLSLRYGYSKLPWTPENAAENVVLRPDRLAMPLRWQRPRMVFVNSMSDLFHELVPFHFIDDVFATMDLARRHVFQVLTKRPERMREYMTDADGPHRRALFRAAAAALDGTRWPPTEWPLSNVWLGTSIENNRWVERADALRATPAAIRFISAEPLLGPLDKLDLTGIDWLIVGGESAGPPERSLLLPGSWDGRRPTGWYPKPSAREWVRDLRDRAAAAGVAFFFKQWGGPRPKSGGRELDGRTWDEMPARQAVAA